MKKVALYCRVASKNHDDMALNIQEQNLRNYAKNQGYKIIEIIREIGSGTNLNRSSINKIHETIDDHKIDAVIAKNISRYGRCSNSKIVNFIDRLAKKGVKTITMQDGDLQDILSVLRSMV